MDSTATTALDARVERVCRHLQASLDEPSLQELADIAGELLPVAIDPIEVADSLRGRYDALWDEVTREEVFQPEEQRYRVAERLHGHGVGRSKKEAEQQAAESAYRTLADELPAPAVADASGA